MADQMPRGAIPSPRHKLAAATPHRDTGITPPNLIYIPQQLSFWGNDRHGDCVTAEEAFAKACFVPEIFISEQEAISWATQHHFLNGANIHVVMEIMINDGFQQKGRSYDDEPALAVDWTNADTLKNAIAQGPIKTGVAADQLQHVHTGTNGWFATGFHRDEHLDHCVSLCGYGTMAWLAQRLGVQVPTGVDGGQPGYAMFTWSSIGIIDEPSLLAITGEAWLRSPTTETKALAASVTVYEDANFEGKSASLGVGRHDLEQIGIANDTLSSLKVPMGMVATLYEDANFSGRSKSFTRDISYVGDDFNDITSSIVVAAAVITVYEDANFEGKSASLGVGRHDLEQIGIANDSLSSLKVPTGMAATLYEDIHFGGRSKTFTRDIRYVGDDFNDIASSIVVEITS